MNELINLQRITKDEYSADNWFDYGTFNLSIGNLTKVLEHAFTIITSIISTLPIYLSVYLALLIQLVNSVSLTINLISPHFIYIYILRYLTPNEKFDIDQI